jgi:pimeloyl-ACP methyl ester carboxylesterase
VKKQTLLLLGIVLVFLGGLVAWYTQTSGGTITIKDVRFISTNGTQMSALLYIPEGVTAENPAPGILAIHGYINSRETQAGYAIEFARRGYVVLALDQTGHGYSDAPAFASGFGGPLGLAYLRSLDIVDTENIGMEGHSMGGWASLAAASVMPDDYKSINLQGSSTGAPFAQEGSAEYPRNLALTYSVWDEFAELMWGGETPEVVDLASEIENTTKLQTLFGTDEPVVEGQLYGSIEDGTARILYQPITTHPGDHISPAAIATAIDWMAMTLEGGNDLESSNQVWIWNELGRLVALIGMVLAVMGFGAILLDTDYFRELAKPTPEPGVATRPMVYIGYLLTIFIPILTFFWLQNFANRTLVPQANALFSQNITTGIMVWAVGNALITLILFIIWHFASNQHNGATIANYGLSLNGAEILKSLLLSVLIVGFAYILLAISDWWFKTDFRFWVVAVKLMSTLQFRIFLGYLPFFTFFFIVLGLALHGQLRPVTATGQPVGFWHELLLNVVLLISGFVVLLIIQYIPLMTGGRMPLGEPLLTIVAFQFVGLLAIVAVWMTWFFRKTGTVYVGAFVAALFITWVIVAGQATHYAF